MLVNVFKENVIEGLSKAANIIPTKTGMAYLRSIWLKAEKNTLTIMATDSNIEFSGTYPADVTSEGLVGVNGRNFVDLLRKLSSGVPITLSLEEGSNNLLISQKGTRNYKLPTNDSVWFQNFSDFPEDNPVVWSGDYLAELIDKIFYCIADDESKDAIGCLYINPVESGHIDACGLNGHQFAMLRFLHDELHARLPKEGILIQRKYLGEMKKWLGADEIELNVTEKRLFLRTCDKKEMFSLPLSAYTYPDYSNFLSRIEGGETSKLVISRKDSEEALERLLIFISENNRCTYFSLSEKEALLSSNGIDVGSASETLEVEYDGNIQKIAFPTRNLLEIMDHFRSEKLTMIMSGTEGPCGIKGSDDPEYTVIIMPMKIVDNTYYQEEKV